MTEFLHTIVVDEQLCKARLACVRACPTQAIRVRDSSAKITPLLCIDCGECIVACPEGAIKAFSDTLEDARDFKLKVAIPSPALFGQFPGDVTPADIIDGLLKIGFDAVYYPAMEAEIVNIAIRDYLDSYRGPYPLIALACPVVVRLIQVAYPDMVDQIIPIEPPRELAGREMKKFYSRKTGYAQSEIAAIYIAPCQAKVVSVKQPAEGVESYLDLAIGISDIYNALLKAITDLRTADRSAVGRKRSQSNIQSAMYLSWAMTGGQCQSLKPDRYISVSQIPNIITIFDDIEKGKLKGQEFLECYACTGGCVGGPMTVADRYVNRSRIQKLIENIKGSGLSIKKEAKRRYEKDTYIIRQPLRPRTMENLEVTLGEQIRRMKDRETILKELPGIDCNLCGAPSCAAFANDVANGISRREECIFLSDHAVIELKERYGRHQAKP